MDSTTNEQLAQPMELDVAEPSVRPRREKAKAQPNAGPSKKATGAKAKTKTAMLEQRMKAQEQQLATVQAEMMHQFKTMQA